MRIDINLLPSEYRPKRWALPLAVALIVAILAVGYYGYGFFNRNGAAHAQNGVLESQLKSINTQVDQVTKNPDIKKYTDLVKAAQTEVDRLKAQELDYEKWNSQRIYWKPVLQTIRELTPSDVILKEITQQSNQAIVKGELGKGITNSTVIVEFANLLQNRDIFSQVAFNISTEERTIEEKKEKIIIFSLLLEVKAKGAR